MNKIIRYIRIILFTTAFIAVALSVFTQTRIFKNLIRDIIISELNKIVDGKFLINKIDGNLFTDISIEDVRLMYKDTLVIAVKRILLDYDVFSLLQSKINVRSLIIDSLEFNLVQAQDSSFNISSVFKTSDDTSSSPFLWAIAADEINIRNGTISFSFLDDNLKLPEKINNFNVRLNGNYSSDSSRINLVKMSFDALNPDLSVKDFNFTSVGNGYKIEILKLYLETQFNKFYAEGAVSLDSFDEVSLDLKTTPIILSEFSGFTSFELNNISPAVILNMNKKDENIILESSITDKEQQVSISAELMEGHSYKGSARIKFSNLDLVKIFSNSSPDGIVNGGLDINGDWLDPSDNNLELNGELFNSEIIGRELADFKIHADFKKGNLNANVSLSGDFGKANTKADIKGIFKNPVFSFQADMENINLSKILLTDSIYSDLNLSINGSGRSFVPEKMFDNLSIISTKSSSVRKFYFDSLVARISRTPDSYKLDELLVKNNENNISAVGEYFSSGSIKSEIILVIKNFDNIKPLIETDTLYGNLTLKSELSGTLDSLDAEAELDLIDFQYNDVHVDSFNGKVSGILSESRIAGEFRLLADGIVYDSIYAKEIKIRGNYSDHELVSEASIKISESLKTEIVSSILIDSIITADISEIKIEDGANNWNNHKGNIIFSYNQDNYSLKNFNIQKDSSFISIDAEINKNKNLYAEIDVHSIDLERFMNNYGISGLVDLNIDVSGEITNPEAAGNLKFSDFNVDKYKIGDITAALNIKDNRFEWNLSTLSDSNNVKFSGNVPFVISEGGSSVYLDDQKELTAELVIDSFDISSIQLISGFFDEISGTLNCRVSIGNNLKEPEVKGILRVAGANIKMNKAGVDYKDIIIKLESNLNRISIDTASLTSSKGMISLSGYLGSTTNILRGKLDDSNIRLHSSNFELINGRGVNVLLEGDLNLYSEGENTRFKGDFTIPKSSFYLPSLKQSQPGSKSDEPLLVQSLKRNQVVDAEDTTIKEISPLLAALREDVNGSIRVLIPDNTWMKSPNINVGLIGDLSVEKIDKDLVINGWLKTGRGNLYFYGKKFTISKGELIFKGGKDINPFITLNIEYVFRNASGDKEKLTIDVTNTVKDPQITFAHEYEVISEADAVSLIIFGIRTKNLSQSQQSAISSSQDVLTNAVAGFLASELSSTLGKKIGLDVLEISGNENWETASLTAGNYITEDLFVSYERGIPLGNSNEVETNKIITEYEVFTDFFIQLIGGNSTDTGLNFIIKFY